MTAPIATLEDLRGRHALVLGLARSGTAVARLLADAGAIVSAYDRRPPEQLAEAVQALGGRPVRLALGVPPTRHAPWSRRPTCWSPARASRRRCRPPMRGCAPR